MRLLREQTYKDKVVTRDKYHVYGWIDKSGRKSLVSVRSSVVRHVIIDSSSTIITKSNLGPLIGWLGVKLTAILSFSKLLVGSVMGYVEWSCKHFWLPTL